MNAHPAIVRGTTGAGILLPHVDGRPERFGVALSHLAAAGALLPAAAWHQLDGAETAHPNERPSARWLYTVDANRNTVTAHYATTPGTWAAARIDS